MRYFLSAIMPVCEEYGVNMCVHPDDPPFQVLGLPRIVTNENDIEWFLNAVDNPHNGLTFCAGSLSAGEHNDTRELAKKFAKELISYICAAQLPCKVETSLKAPILREEDI